jgi:hypothetical protein
MRYYVNWRYNAVVQCTHYTVCTSVAVGYSVNFDLNFLNLDSGNNQIDFDEFVLLVDKYEKPMSQEREIREMFNAIDKDHSGFIDVEELKTTFTTLGVVLSDSDVRTMLKEANIKGDRIFFEGMLYVA